MRSQSAGSKLNRRDEAVKGRVHVLVYGSRCNWLTAQAHIADIPCGNQPINKSACRSEKAKLPLYSPLIWKISREANRTDGEVLRRAAVMGKAKIIFAPFIAKLTWATLLLKVAARWSPKNTLSLSFHLGFLHVLCSS